MAAEQCYASLVLQSCVLQSSIAIVHLETSGGSCNKTGVPSRERERGSNSRAVFKVVLKAFEDHCKASFVVLDAFSRPPRPS